MYHIRRSAAALATVAGALLSLIATPPGRARDPRATTGSGRPASTAPWPKTPASPPQVHPSWPAACPAGRSP